MRFKASRIASMLLAFIAAASLPLASPAKDEKLKPEEFQHRRSRWRDSDRLVVPG
jgi:hypothetical protein